MTHKNSDFKSKSLLVPQNQNQNHYIITDVTVYIYIFIIIIIIIIIITILRPFLHGLGAKNFQKKC